MNLREKYNIPANAVITIAGTVGVGKSTMTKALAQSLNFRTSYEKVDTNPYLDKFYDLSKEKQDRMLNGGMQVFATSGYRHASTDEMVAALFKIVRFMKIQASLRKCTMTKVQ